MGELPHHRLSRPSRRDGALRRHQKQIKTPINAALKRQPHRGGDLPDNGTSRSGSIAPEARVSLRALRRQMGSIRRIRDTRAGRRWRSAFMSTRRAPRAGYAMDALKRSKVGRGHVQSADTISMSSTSSPSAISISARWRTRAQHLQLVADPGGRRHRDGCRLRSHRAVVGVRYFTTGPATASCGPRLVPALAKEASPFIASRNSAPDQRSRRSSASGREALRARQFGEDAGPLAHPVRPSNYQRSTISTRRPSMKRRWCPHAEADHQRTRSIVAWQLYFERRDGTASTVGNFIGFAFEASANSTPSCVWYEQTGTPALKSAAWPR